MKEGEEVGCIALNGLVTNLHGRLVCKLELGYNEINPPNIVISGYEAFKENTGIRLRIANLS